MTYCVGMLIEAGLVMIADTRTNAGVDNISVYRKRHIYEGDDRFIAIATAGNLSVPQSTLSKMEEGISNPQTSEHKTTYIRNKACRDRVCKFVYDFGLSA